MKRRYPIALLILVLAVLFLVMLCRPEQPRQVRQTRLQLGTVVEITAFGPEDSTEDAVRGAFDEIDRVEALMSSHRSDSEVSRFNQASRTAPLSVETLQVIEAGLRYSRLTGGTNDVALRKLNRL